MSDFIDRFLVRKVLGRGGQGIVYLAHDPRLGRDVAIKTIAAKDQGDVHQLLQEARTVSALRHPCIVPLYEAGEFRGAPYLVFEYVTGETLLAFIRRNGALPQESVLRIASQILDGLAHAHKNGVLHRDIKPANIMLESDGTPRIMDFGAASRQQFNWLNAANVSVDDRFIGTPAYMAPEYIEHKQFSAQTDIYAAGLVIGEMLTGQRVIQGSGRVEDLLHRVVHEPIQLPTGPGLDEKMVACLLKALAKKPRERYDSVIEMKDALLRTVQDEPALQQSRGTLEFLLRRMKLKKEFPAMSQSISTVNRIIFSDKGSLAALTNAVLKDFGLTSKIIRLANSAYYHRSGTASVSTVTGAVYRLGFDTIRNIVLSLLMFDQLKDRGHATELMGECVQAVLGGAIAKEMSVSLGYANPEEIFVCSMMHNLGRILSLYYFPEESEEIGKLMATSELDEEAASRNALGASYTELGQGVAKSWGFPAQMINSMQKHPPSNATRDRASPEETVRLLAGMASELAAAVVKEDDSEQRDRRTAEALEKYKGHVPLTEKAVHGLMGEALEGFSDYTKAAGWAFDPTISRRIAAMRDAAEATAEGQDAAAAAEETTLTEEAVSGPPIEATLKTDPRAAEFAPVRDEPRAKPAILSGGIQDITFAMVEGRSLNDILRIIVETMYTGIGFDHVILASREKEGDSIVGRFGLGEGIDQMVHQFRMPIHFVPDVFHAAIQRNIDVYIADTRDEKIAKRIPEWYRNSFGAGTMVLFPIVVKDRVFGLIYADAESANSITIPDTDLKLLRTLRNQAVLAVRQSLLED